MQVQRVKAKYRLFLLGIPVSRVTYYVKKLTASFSAIIECHLGLEVNFLVHLQGFSSKIFSTSEFFLEMLMTISGIRIRTDTVFLTVYQGAEKFNLKKYEILI